MEIGKPIRTIEAPAPIELPEPREEPTQVPEKTPEKAPEKVPVPA